MPEFTITERVQINRVPVSEEPKIHSTVVWEKGFREFSLHTVVVAKERCLIDTFPNGTMYCKPLKDCDIVQLFGYTEDNRVFEIHQEDQEKLVELLSNYTLRLNSDIVEIEVSGSQTRVSKEGVTLPPIGRISWDSIKQE